MSGSSWSRVVTLLVVLMSAVGCQAVEPTATPTPRPISTPTTLGVSALCQAATQDYLAQIQPLLEEWDDAVEVANSTARIALSPLVRDMQGIQRDVGDVTVPDCARHGSGLLIDGMDSVIDSFIAFMGEESDSVVSLYLSSGNEGMTMGLEELAALAEGRIVGTSTAVPRHVVVLLDWFPNTNHTGLYVALEKGWYSDQGLEVEIIEPAEGSTLVQVVAAGQADFGISYQEEVSYARAEDMPIVSIAAIIQHNTSGFASPKGRNITRPKDFEGKRYGSWGSPSERAVLDVLMSCDGGDVDDVEFIDIGWADYFTVIQRDVDFAWIFYGWTGVEAELRGTPLDVVMLSDWSDCVPDYYTPVIITSEQTVAEEPDLVRSFMAATARGYESAISNPAEAAEILLKYAPESNADLVRRSQEWLSPQYQADASRWGEQKLETWQTYADWMADRELLPHHIDAEEAFTNEFLP